MRRDRSVVIGAVLLLTIVITSLVVPLVSPYSATELTGVPLQAPSASHLLGTDQIGRDILTRIAVAARIDLLIGTVAVGLSMLLGTTLGSIAAFARRRWPQVVLMRIVDVVVAFPFLVLVLTVVLVLGDAAAWGPIPAGLPALLIAIVIWDWTVYARVAAVQTRQLRGAEFVSAARVAGFGRLTILRRHIVPHVVRASIAYAIADAVAVLMATASLPFIGAGVRPPTPEWGMMMFEGRTVLVNAPWVVLAPGLLLAATAIALSMLADGLLVRDEVRG